MKLDYDLEEIFTLAYNSAPILTEYHLNRILQDMPLRVEIIAGRRGMNEYELDDPAVSGENPERRKLENFISRLRSSKI